jgi:predicted CoA-substrate-specific enzyme activase
MIAAGCDVGSLTVKTVILEDNKILGYEIIPATSNAVQSASDAMDYLLAKLNLSYNDISHCTSTGYGRTIIPFAQDNISEISCHGKGAHWLAPSVRTIIDIGGQDYKAIKIDENGKLESFLMNSKCAAGTGRTMEIVAESLDVDISQLGPLSLEASDPISFSHICGFLIDIEVRHLVLEGEKTANIAAGINSLTASRVATLARLLPPKNDIVVTGGLAKNVGVVKGLELALKTQIVQLKEDPQIVGALGAAVFASQKAENNALPGERN